MSIVFGTTLTPDNQLLGEVAARLAQRMNVPLCLVHVAEDLRAPVVLGTDAEHVLGPVRTHLEGEAERLRALTHADVRTKLVAGTAVTALVSVAETEHAHALVMGGVSVGRSLLGATAERASRKSKVPVITLRDPERLLPWLRAERPLRVLVGVDFGRAAEAARVFAAGLGKVGPCEVEIVLVVSPDEAHERLGLPPSPRNESGLVQEAQDALLRDLGRAAPNEERGVVLRVLSARGSADAHLVSLADQAAFDLVVVGQRRHSILEELWYGSVARGVLRASPVSVASVPAASSVKAAAYRPPRVVVVATDFTEIGDRAIAQAMGSVVPGGTVHLVHVVPFITSSKTEAQEAREQARRVLAEQRVGDAEHFARLERHVLEGAAAEQLLAFSDRIGADLLVLGARSKPAVDRFVLGSVAREIAERATTPVLLVPATPA